VKEKCSSTRTTKTTINAETAERAENKMLCGFSEFRV
jgi:hypothetical protein